MTSDQVLGDALSPPDRTDRHAADCACCSAADPRDAAIDDEAHAASLGILSGLAVGLLLCALIDWITGQHGLLLMLGLR